MLTSPMDGSPQVVRFDAATLWHLDAAEWAPSTASFATIALRTRVRLSPDFRHVRRLSDFVAMCQERTLRTYGPPFNRRELEHFPSALNRRDSQPLSPRRIWGN